MTDRIHSITLILDQDIRIDDAEGLIAAARYLKGVIEVVPNVADPASKMAESRALQEVRKKVSDALWP